jgi:hypothetical protein
MTCILAPNANPEILGVYNGITEGVFKTLLVAIMVYFNDSRE